MTPQTYYERKEKLEQMLTQLISLRDHAKLNNDYLYELLNSLTHNTFQLIVVGEFSTGKSTFINALLGEDILPSKIRPTTATITAIKYGEPDVIVNYKDSTIKNILLEDLKHFATALDDSKYEEAQKINYIDVFFPCKLTKNEVVIIDTPGVEDLDEQREEITYGMIPKGDAAILLLDVRRPLKNSEKVFLKEQLLANDIKKIFFILNFVDNVVDDDEEISEVIQYTAKNLKNILSTEKEIKVFAISSKMALKAKQLSEYDSVYWRSFEELENTLQHFLINEKGNLLLSNISTKTTKAANELGMHYQMIYSSLDSSIDELEEKARKQKELIQEVELRRVKLKSKVKSGLEDVFLSIEPYINIAVKNAIQQMKKNPPKVEKEKIKEVISKSLQRNLKQQIAKDVTPKLEKELEEVVKSYEQELADILNEIQYYKQTEFLGSTSFNSLAVTVVGGQVAMTGFVIGGASLGLLVGLAITAIVSAPIFIPTAIIGGIVGLIVGENLIGNMAIKMMIDGLMNNDEKIVKEVAMTIKGELEKIESKIITMIDKTINSEIEILNNTMSVLLEEKKVVGADINSKRDELVKKTDEVNSLIEQLSELIHAGGEKVVNE